MESEKGGLKMLFGRFCIMVVGLVLEGVPVSTGSADFQGLSQELVFSPSASLKPICLF